MILAQDNRGALIFNSAQGPGLGTGMCTEAGEIVFEEWTDEDGPMEVVLIDDVEITGGGRTVNKRGQALTVNADANALLRFTCAAPCRFEVRLINQA